MMKKRFEQRLVLLALVAFFVFNIPFISIWNKTNHVWGFPVLWLWIFFVWLMVIIISYVTLKSGHE